MCDAFEEVVQFQGLLVTSIFHICLYFSLGNDLHLLHHALPISNRSFTSTSRTSTAFACLPMFSPFNAAKSASRGSSVTNSVRPSAWPIRLCQSMACWMSSGSVVWRASRMNTQHVEFQSGDFSVEMYQFAAPDRFLVTLKTHIHPLVPPV